MRISPAARMAAIAEAGGLGAFVEPANAASVQALTTALRLIADLGLGRIYEGHVNAAQIVHAYATAAQRESPAAGNAAGRLLGVWNIEPSPGMTIVRDRDGSRLSGAKSFATEGGHIDGALITVRNEAGAKQLVLVGIADLAERADNSGWQVRRMRGTCSGPFDLDGLLVDERSIIGGYEREPQLTAGPANAGRRADRPPRSSPKWPRQRRARRGWSLPDTSHQAYRSCRGSKG